MARLSHEQIKAEVEKLGYSLIDDSNYTTLNSFITVKCKNNHNIKATLNDLRKPSFTCPCCDKPIVFNNPRIVPEKKGYRIIAFDQATEHFGVSIWDNGELVFYSLYNFTGDLVSRLLKIKQFVQQIVIDNWKPDFIIMEDIQQQHGAIITYKILAMLLGVIEVVCKENNIKYEVVSPNTWRKYAGTCGKNRKEEKILSVAKVKEKFGINVSDDVAEAILIGNYAVRTHQKEYPQAFGI